MKREKEEDREKILSCSENVGALILPSGSHNYAN